MPSKNSGMDGETAAVGPNVENENDIRSADEIKNELLRVLEIEAKYKKENYIEIKQPEIRAAIETWFKLYHCLVYLAAATQKPNFHKTIEKDENGNDILKYGHYVPAFTSGEDEEGWFFEGNTKQFGGLKTEPIKGLITEYQNRYSEESLGIAVQDLKIDTVYYYIQQKAKIGNETRPLLQSFLMRCNKFIAEDENSGPTEWFNSCYDSASKLKESDVFHPNTVFFVQQALNLIQQVWGEQIKEHLHAITGWLAVAELSPKKFAPILAQKLEVGELETVISSGNEKAKLEVCKMIAMLYINQHTYRFMYDRFEGQPDMNDISHCLEKAIAGIKKHLPESYHKMWDNLLFATYGAIVWQMTQQVNQTITAIRKI
ncbi:MAG: hypothetical protein JW953_13660 [Anaerolineae bacterium]|nr:hypothetical protein [Anaerolineae bacterium]